MSQKRKKQMPRARQPKAGKQRTEKLILWQQRLADSDAYWSPETIKMDEREAIYKGDRKLQPLVKGDKPKEQAPHIRNIVFENIESMVSTSIPSPKVTAVHSEDEGLAEIIENHIRNVLDKLNTETNNDMAERTVPMQGGVLFHEEWDETKRTHTSAGEFCDTVVHPKQLAPQPGVYTDIEDMDWYIIKRPTTKSVIRRKYGVNVESEQNSEPMNSSSNKGNYQDESLTMYVGYERNDEGGINKYVWVNDIELEDLENYQARRQPTCSKCGRLKPLPGQLLFGISEKNLQQDAEREMMAGHALAQNIASNFEAIEDEEMFMPEVPYTMGEDPEPVEYDDGPCPWCGCDEWEEKPSEYERVFTPIHRNFGEDIPGQYIGVDENGLPAMVPTLIPFYKPDIYPTILQKSVSVFGQLLGNSDVDAIRDQQNTTNRIEKKVIDRLLKAGSRITLPDDARLRIDPNDGDIWYLGKISDRNMIGVYEFSGDLQFELMYLSQVYEESRQILGITDSFQGRKDVTATSGKAKEFSASQAAGRMESKRVLKNAAYAKKFELMFKYYLAYADEPRPVVYKNFKGETIYKEFNRYDFLKKDANGQWYWNTDFLFSVDTAGPLAANREAMWQETRMNLQTGAFGPPEATETLILFWGKMELLHYPGAASTKKYLEEKLEREQEQARQAQKMQLEMMRMQYANSSGGVSAGVPRMPAGAAI